MHVVTGEVADRIAPAVPAQTTRDSRSFAWVEPLDSLLYLTAFGVLGTLLRGGLVQLFTCYSTSAVSECRSLDDGALFVTLAPNMLGCFLVGLLATPTAAGVTAEPGGGGGQLLCLPPSHRWQRYACV